MQDLLNEEDFTTPIPKPWKRFRIFYAVNFGVLVGFFIFFKFVFENEPSDIAGILVFIAMPIASAFIMAFDKKENVLLPFKTITLAIFLLISIYIVAIPSAAALLNREDFFSDETLEILLAIFLGYMLIFTVVTSLIILIVNYIKKNKS
ncbi:hypothetical protein [Flavobacterium sp.]|uniref:hypothetical protein n=1 Tax=Flavobacterium sp. TaxID=239 RepID=UPI004034CFE4